MACSSRQQREVRMSTLRIIGIAGALLAAASAGVARAEEQVVYTNWSHTSEEAALRVLRDAWEKQGHKWKDLAIAHDFGVNVSLINMITGGNPPTIFMNSDPGLIRDMVKQGLGFPLTKLYTDYGVVQHLPAAVLRNVTVDGEIMKAPVTLHIDGMIYYNKHVADAVGVDPKSWKSLDDFFAVYDKVAAAGYIPLAQGGESSRRPTFCRRSSQPRRGRTSTTSSMEKSRTERRSIRPKCAKRSRASGNSPNMSMPARPIGNGMRPPIS